MISELKIEAGTVQMIYQRSSFLKYAAMRNGDKYLTADMEEQAAKIKKALGGAPLNGDSLLKLDKLRKKIMTFGRYMGLQKLDGVIKTVSEYLRENPDNKAVVFCWYADTMVQFMDLTKKEFGTKTVYPGTGPDSVAEKMDLFKGVTARGAKTKTKKTTRLIVADIRADNIVLDYSPATRVFFAEFAWNAEQNVAALKRCGLPKKKKDITFITLSSSLDEQILATIKPEVEKQLKG